MAHEPVLADSVVDYLAPGLRGGGVVVDATVGEGGHARRLLDVAPSVHLVGIDRDPEALEAARANLSPYAKRVRLVRDNFQNLEAVLERLGVKTVRGVLFDLGVSSSQLDEARRGFGFRRDGPLDMRMDPRQQLSADDVVNAYPARELEVVIRRYGEERFARRVAEAIVRARPVEGTRALAEVVANAIPARARRTGGHPARRAFQAIRIEVNGELQALETTLPAAVSSLAAAGRLAVISYHSLEDRLVKRALADGAKGCVCPPGFPVCSCGARARLRILTRRPVRPERDEVASNPRARSAKLRVAERLQDAPLEADAA